MLVDVNNGNLVVDNDVVDGGCVAVDGSLGITNPTGPPGFGRTKKSPGPYPKPIDTSRANIDCACFCIETPPPVPPIPTSHPQIALTHSVESKNNQVERECSGL